MEVSSTYKEIIKLLSSLEYIEDPIKRMELFASALSLSGTSSIATPQLNSEIIQKSIFESWNKLMSINNSNEVTSIDVKNINTLYVSKFLEIITKIINESLLEFSNKVQSPTCIIIELIFILKTFKVEEVIENKFVSESLKIFELAKKFGYGVYSRKENLEMEISELEVDLKKIDTNDFYDSNLINLLDQIKKTNSWKFFRKINQKNEEIKKLKIELDNCKINLKNNFLKRIDKIRKEILQFEPVSRTGIDDFKFKEFSDFSMSSHAALLKETTLIRLKEFLNLKITEIDSKYDLISVQELYTEFLSTLEIYKNSYLKNKQNFQITESDINQMFKEILDEICEEYFD